MTSSQPLRSPRRSFNGNTSSVDMESGRVSSSSSRLSLVRSSEDVVKMFSSLPTVFDFTKFAMTSDKITAEGRAFVQLIDRVRQDVTEASRLYASQPVCEYLELWPDKKAWVDGILLDTQQSLNDIGAFMETVQVSGEDNGVVTVRRKFEWVLSHHKRMISKQQYLTLCHQSLMATVTFMQTAEMTAMIGANDPIHEVPSRPWIPSESTELLKSPYSRQKWRLSHKNSSLPSIMVSDAGSDRVEELANEASPHELPGSVPDDLPDPDNWDLYTPPGMPRASPENRMSAASRDSLRSDQTKDSLESAYKSRPPSTTTPIPEDSALTSVTPASPDHSDPPLQRQQHTIGNAYSSSRRRAHSDQMRAQAPYEIRARASFERSRTLPVVSEKPIERYDSSASVSVVDAASISVNAPRIRPKAVNVARQPAPKHSSLPTHLPYVASQSSLLEELCDWVVPISTNRVSPNTYATDTTASLSGSTPATSASTSPVVTDSPMHMYTVFEGIDRESAPLNLEFERSMKVVEEPASLQPPRKDSPTLPNGVSSPPSEQDESQTGSDDPSGKPALSRQNSMRSTEKPTPAPAEQAPNTNAAASMTSTASSPAKDISEQKMPQDELMQRGTSHASTSVTSPGEKELAANTPLDPQDIKATSPTDQGPVALTQPTPLVVTSQAPPSTQVSEPEAQASPSSPVSRKPLPQAANVTSAASPASPSVPASLPSPPAHASSEPQPRARPPIPQVPQTDTAPSQAEVPMSAQAKRRAAHRRRMHLAYGGQQD